MEFRRVLFRSNGRGLLLGNPHYPWHGILRFCQMHLTIPGKMDVMGVSLPGVPAVAIGFTKDFAWSHTVNTSVHFRSEEHTSELQSLMRISYAVFCLKKKHKNTKTTHKYKNPHISNAPTTMNK